LSDVLGLGLEAHQTQHHTDNDVFCFCHSFFLFQGLANGQPRGYR
jgi:hypothetical protein